jgi:dephospho-CoA kinase
MGYPGAGKSFGARMASRYYDAPKVAIGDVVRDHAREELGESASSADIGEWVTAQLAEDERAINNWVIDRIREENPGELAIIDGIRTPSDVEVFTEEFDQFSLVFIHADFETRLDRLRDRGRDGEDAFVAADLEERDAREDDWGVKELLDSQAPDLLVENDGTLAEFDAGLRGAVTFLLDESQLPKDPK